MRPLQFSLLSLMGTVLVVAIGCAALRYASELWASEIFTATAGALFVAILGALFRRRSARAFSVGFALCGGGYLLLVVGPWFNVNIKNRLVTTKVLAYLHPNLADTGTFTLSVGPHDDYRELTKSLIARGDVKSVVFTPPGTLVARRRAVPSWEHFEQVGHSLIALLTAVFGGMVARHFVDQSERADSAAQQKISKSP